MKNLTNNANICLPQFVPVKTFSKLVKSHDESATLTPENLSSFISEVDKSRSNFKPKL